MALSIDDAAFPPPLAPGDMLSSAQFAALMRRNVLAAFTRRAFEDDFIARRLFGRAQVTLNRAEAIRHVLIDNAANYTRTAATVRLLHPIVGDGLFLAEGEDWREQRRTVAPSFAPRTMPILARHVATATEPIVAELAAARGPVDLLEAMHRLAIDVAGRSMFSLEMARFGPRMRTMLRQYGERLARPSVLDIMLPVSLPAPRDFARRRFRRRWLALIDEIVAARRAKPEPGPVPEAAGGGARDLLDLLATDPETGAPIPAPRLADQVATMISAGHATTAVALFWALFLIASVPAAQQRIADETAAIDLGPEGAADALPRLVYTRAVIQEALRLYPPAHGIFRQALREDNAGGVPVPAGAVVMVSPWLLHRHRKLWDAPDRFDPTRFLPGAPAPDRFSYLPFGVGPRVCIGAQFALTEATLVLARLVQEFDIRRADNGPVMPMAAITVRPDVSPPFLLRARG